MDAAENKGSLSLGRVALVVNDLDRVGDFYRKAVGLHLLSSDGESAALGAGGDVLLELRRDPAARRRSPREAGLFHTAFLLPSRADLGGWIRHAVEAGIRVSGASDHIVSEALYLSDPEGNGIEIYADRPSGEWTWRDGMVAMSTDALDVDDLLGQAGPGRWTGMAEGTVVGHVHLQVGALPAAEAFYSGLLGFGVTSRYPGGTFYAVDDYHHHLATNIWNSRGAGPRDVPSTGLADVEIRTPPAFLDAVEARLDPSLTARRRDGRLTLADPWGTAVTLVGPAA